MDHMFSQLFAAITAGAIALSGAPTEPPPQPEPQRQSQTFAEWMKADDYKPEPVEKREPLPEPKSKAQAVDNSRTSDSFDEAVANGHVITDAQQAWVDGLLERSGLPVQPNITYMFTDDGNCGGPGGGCMATRGFEKLLYVSPSAAMTPYGEHVFFHEYAHAIGHMEECEAEEFARLFHDVPVGSYAGCPA